MTAQSGALLVRHLLMPGHLECCTRPALEWIRATVPTAAVNLMTAYHPFALKGAKGPMRGPLKSHEIEDGIRLFKDLEFPDAMIDGEPV